MAKKALNQNGIYVQKLIDTIEPDFAFSNDPNNRLKVTKSNNEDKAKLLLNLEKKINSIENCKLKDNSTNLIMGDGDINSAIMLIGEAPGEIEDNTGHTFQGDIGLLLKKMLLAINVKLEKVYSTYSINFRTPEDRKPSTQEIKRYSVFLKKHISIINPKLIII